jgi:hypothetical protein
MLNKICMLALLLTAACASPTVITVRPGTVPPRVVCHTIIDHDRYGYPYERVVCR